MDISVQAGNTFQAAFPLVAAALWEDEALPPDIANLVDPDDFQGQARHMLLLYPHGSLPARRVLLVGLGKRSDQATDVDSLRHAAARIIQKAREHQVDRLAVSLPRLADLSPALVAQAFSEGALLGGYQCLDYKSHLTPEQSHQITSLTLVVADDPGVVEQGVALGQHIAEGVILARNLANAPGNVVTPARLGEVARELGERYAMRVQVLDPAELEAQGFGGILAVGRGSAEPPCFIVLEHGQPAPDRPTICLVGKGITFDTGGISIKPAEKMDDMKMDMGGAAAVLGSMQVAAALELPLHLVGLIAAAENMPGSRAYKPGDIIKTLSGQTIEVLNTDAEGRIVLSDALFYAQRYQPQAIVDLATLTGAITIALGPHAIGLLSNNQALAEQLLQAGQIAAERAWQLPLWEAYRDMVKSDIADLKNAAGRQGGAITAAALLSAFVGDYPWAHLDIAGTAWTEKPGRAYQVRGATGVGVRLITTWLREQASRHTA